jgi:hypothetical protein
VGAGGNGSPPVGSMGEMCPNCHWLQNTIVALLGERAASRRDCCSSNKAATKITGISKIGCKMTKLFICRSHCASQLLGGLERAKNTLTGLETLVVTEIWCKYSDFFITPLVTPTQCSPPPPPPPRQKQRRLPGTLKHCPHGYSQCVCRGDAHPQGSGAVGALQPQRGLLPILRSGQSGQAPQPAQRVAHKDVQVPLLRRSSRCCC